MARWILRWWVVLRWVWWSRLIQRVLFWVRVADLRLGDLNNHICYKFSELFGCKSEGLIGFWPRESVLAYHWGVWLLIVDHMLSERLLFVFRTPFVRSNMCSVTICTCGFSWFSARASYLLVSYGHQNLTYVIIYDYNYFVIHWELTIYKDNWNPFVTPITSFCFGLFEDKIQLTRLNYAISRLWPT